MHHTILLIIYQAVILNLSIFRKKRSTYFVWLASDLESALKIDLETVKKRLYIPKQGGPFSQPDY